MNDLERVIEKIQKLLAMASDTSSPNEALIAAKRARAMMDKHQLSKEDIEKHTGNQFLETKAERETKLRQTWIRYLCGAAAMMNDCVCVLKTHRTVSYQFQGFKSDAIVAKLTADYLIETCDRLCEASSARGRSEKNYFRLGFAESVAKRALMIAKEREREFVNSATGTALVPMKKAMIAEHFGELKAARAPNVREPNSSEIDSYVNGRVAGNDVGLDKQVTGAESLKLDLAS
jgi:hypothetical protein